MREVTISTRHNRFVVTRFDGELFSVAAERPLSALDVLELKVRGGDVGNFILAECARKKGVAA